MAGKCYIEIGFANAVVQKRANLLILEGEITESVLLTIIAKLRRLYIGALEGNAEQLKSI